MISRLTQYVSLVATGLLAGIFVAGVFTMTAMRQQTAAVYTVVAAATHETYAPLMTPILVPALVATGVLVVMSRRDRVRFGFTVAAMLLLVVATASTIIVNVPINGQMMDAWVTHGPPADWAVVRDRWNAWHAFRTVLTVAAFGCLAAPGAAPGAAAEAAAGAAPGAAPGAGSPRLAR